MELIHSGDRRGLKALQLRCFNSNNDQRRRDLIAVNSALGQMRMSPAFLIPEAGAGGGFLGLQTFEKAESLSRERTRIDFLIAAIKHCF